MLTLAAFEGELHRLVRRAVEARLGAAEIADVLQGELPALDVLAGDAADTVSVASGRIEDADQDDTVSF